MSAATAVDSLPRARSALASSPIWELQNLQVEQHAGALLVSGSVSSFYHKQLAQEVIRSVCLDVPLVNAIRVLAAEWAAEFPEVLG